MSWRLSGGAALVIAFLVAVVPGRPASAETLEQALADAYLINPVLNAERARLRATDEQVALAKSGLRPFISGSADYGFENTDNDVSRPRGTTASGSALGISSAGGAPTGTSHPRGWSVQLTQPLFEGFQNLNAVRQAKATVQAARESLRTVEQ
ncbi:TolC family protein, partial [Methyloceanibacter sp.]|uniref:TolC family protein n=1 Tax=Methyloceanibacter sp. TaxID=1965321 RepID=UPI002D2F9A34